MCRFVHGWHEVGRRPAVVCGSIDSGTTGWRDMEFDETREDGIILPDFRVLCSPVEFAGNRRKLLICLDQDVSMSGGE